MAQLMGGRIVGFMASPWLGWSVASELDVQGDRAEGVGAGLLIEFPRAPDPHHREPDSVTGGQPLRAEARRGLRDPGTAGDAVAGAKEVAIEGQAAQNTMRHAEAAACRIPRDVRPALFSMAVAISPLANRGSAPAPQ